MSLLHAFLHPLPFWYFQWHFYIMKSMLRHAGKQCWVDIWMSVPWFVWSMHCHEKKRWKDNVYSFLHSSLLFSQIKSNLIKKGSKLHVGVENQIKINVLFVQWQSFKKFNIDADDLLLQMDYVTRIVCVKELPLE